MAARRLLNRAVASSSLDPRFLDDFAQLVASEPHALVRSCVECAGIDAEQAELVFQLLVHSPTLSTIDDAAEQRPLLLCRLRDQIDRAALLPSAQQEALLLFAARLTGTSEATNAPLIERDVLLAACVLPLLQRDGSPQLGLGLRAALQLLSGRAELLTAQQLPSTVVERPLSTDSLVSLLSALLKQLERRAQLPAESMDLLLRCTHSCVQLLLPRVDASSASTSSLLSASRAWVAMTWRTQLHAWPLIDRLQSLSSQSSPSTDGRADGARHARASAGERLVSWLRTEAKPSSGVQALSYLVVAAGAPSIPLRQALPLVLRDVRVTDQASVVAALACGLSQGSPTEWQHAVFKLMPALHASGCMSMPATPAALLDVAPAQRSSAAEDTTTPPMPAAANEQHTVRSAHCLLQAMLAMHGAMGARGVTEPRGVIFASGYAKWLAAALKATRDPLTAAHLLGVTLRATAICPAATSERFFVVRFAALRRVVELRQVAPPSEGGSAAACGADAGRHRRCVDALRRSFAELQLGRDHGQTGAEGGFLSLAEL